MDLDSVKSRINGILLRLKEFYESDTNRYYQDDVKLDIIMIETYLEECEHERLTSNHNNNYYKEFIGHKNVLFCDAWSYLNRLKLKIDKPKKLSEIARNTIKKIMKGKKKENEAYEKLMGSIVSGTTKEKELRINEELNRIVPVTETILIHLKEIFKTITLYDLYSTPPHTIPNTTLPPADLVYDGNKMSLIPNFNEDNEDLTEDDFVEEFYKKNQNPMLQYDIFDNNSILSNLGHRECSLNFMVKEIMYYKWRWIEFIGAKKMEQLDGGAKSGGKKHNKTKSKKKRNNKKTRKNKKKKRTMKKHHKNPK